MITEYFFIRSITQACYNAPVAKKVITAPNTRKTVDTTAVTGRKHRTSVFQPFYMFLKLRPSFRARLCSPVILKAKTR